MKKAVIIVTLCLASLVAAASIYIFGESVNFCPKCGRPYTNAPDTIPVVGGYKLMYICTNCGAKDECRIDSVFVATEPETSDLVQNTEE